MLAHQDVQPPPFPPEERDRGSRTVPRAYAHAKLTLVNHLRLLDIPGCGEERNTVSSPQQTVGEMGSDWWRVADRKIRRYTLGAGQEIKTNRAGDAQIEAQG